MSTSLDSGRADRAIPNTDTTPITAKNQSLTHCLKAPLPPSSVLTAVSRWTWASRYQNVSILDFIGAKGDRCGGNKYSYKMYKAPVIMSRLTNRHPVFLQTGCPPPPVAQPTVSKLRREYCYATPYFAMKAIPVQTSCRWQSEVRSGCSSAFLHGHQPAGGNSTVVRMTTAGSGRRLPSQLTLVPNYAVW